MNKFFKKWRVKLSLPLGGFAIGYCLPLFIIPKRGPNLIGIGEQIIINGKDVESKDAEVSKEEITNLKRAIKKEVDQSFEYCREVWNNNDFKDCGRVRLVESNEWDFVVE